MLSKFGAFPAPVVRSYCSQALLGLAYLHENGVMHRDIKGSNILVSHDGVCKLCDFGGSKRLESEKMQKHTMRGSKSLPRGLCDNISHLGVSPLPPLPLPPTPTAPYFCAPEVFEEHYSFKADIWSLGCVVFQMATGSPPWKDLGISNPVALYNHVKTQTGPPPMVFPAMDPVEDSLSDLKSLIARCFRHNPDERPSARELLNDPFLQETQYHSDDEKSAMSRSIFSAGTPDLLKHLKTPDERREKPSPSCGTTSSRHRRGGSIGTPVRTGLFSPPLPKRRSPQVDTNDWPTWAREYTATTGTKSPKTDNPFDSLQYSNSSTAVQSPLRGIRFTNS
jgi:serine/threonine protein kinase